MLTRGHLRHCYYGLTDVGTKQKSTKMLPKAGGPHVTNGASTLTHRSQKSSQGGTAWGARDATPISTGERGARPGNRPAPPKGIRLSGARGPGQLSGKGLLPAPSPAHLAVCGQDHQAARLHRRHSALRQRACSEASGTFRTHALAGGDAGVLG